MYVPRDAPQYCAKFPTLGIDQQRLNSGTLSTVLRVRNWAAGSSLMPPGSDLVETSRNIMEREASILCTVHGGMAKGGARSAEHYFNSIIKIAYYLK